MLKDVPTYLHGVGHRGEALLLMELLNCVGSFVFVGVDNERASFAHSCELVLQDDDLLEHTVVGHKVLKLLLRVGTWDLPDEELAPAARRVCVPAELVEVCELLEEVLLLPVERVAGVLHHLVVLELRRGVGELDLQGVGLRGDDVLVVEQVDRGVSRRTLSVCHPGASLASVGGLVTHDANLQHTPELLEQRLKHLLRAHSGHLPHEQLHRAAGVLLCLLNFVLLVLCGRLGRHIVRVQKGHHFEKRGKNDRKRGQEKREMKEEKVKEKREKRKEKKKGKKKQGKVGESVAGVKCGGLIQTNGIMYLKCNLLRVFSHYFVTTQPCSATPPYSCHCPLFGEEEMEICSQPATPRTPVTPLPSAVERRQAFEKYPRKYVEPCAREGDDGLLPAFDELDRADRQLQRQAQRGHESHRIGRMISSTLSPQTS